MLSHYVLFHWSINVTHRSNQPMRQKVELPKLGNSFNLTVMMPISSIRAIFKKIKADGGIAWRMMCILLYKVFDVKDQYTAQLQFFRYYWSF